MILKIGICDDEPSIITTIVKYLNHYELAHDIDFEISSFTSAKQLLQTYNDKAGAFHILFLDVEMSGMSGIELATAIREIPDRNVHIVFVSSYPEYMKDSFNVQAFQYLTKPISEKDFTLELNRIVKDLKQSLATKLIVSTSMDEELVFLDEIIYIKSVNSKKKQLTYVLKDRTIDSIGKISDLEKTLQSSGFACPSQGYLIHLQHLNLIRKNELVLSNGDIIPLSRRKERPLREYFNEQLLLLSRKR